MMLDDPRYNKPSQKRSQWRQDPQSKRQRSTIGPSSESKQFEAMVSTARGSAEGPPGLTLTPSADVTIARRPGVPIQGPSDMDPHDPRYATRLTPKEKKQVTITDNTGAVDSTHVQARGHSASSARYGAPNIWLQANRRGSSPSKQDEDLLEHYDSNYVKWSAQVVIPCHNFPDEFPSFQAGNKTIQAKHYVVWMGGSSRSASNKCARCNHRLSDFPRAAACAECRGEGSRAGRNPFLCEACFFNGIEERSSLGLLHKYDMTRDRIQRVGRIPIGSDDEEDKKKKPEKGIPMENPRW